MDIKRVILNVVTLCVACLIAINIYKGQNRKIAEILRIQKEEVEKNEVLIRVGNLKSRLDSYKETYKQRDRREVINTITSLAAACGVKVISLTPLEQIPLEMKVESEIYDKEFFKFVILADDYHQLGKFISNLENDPTTFIVESVSLKSTSIAELEVSAKLEKVRVELTVSELFFKKR